jgi:hypothetical protein
MGGLVKRGKIWHRRNLKIIPTKRFTGTGSSLFRRQTKAKTDQLLQALLSMVSLGVFVPVSSFVLPPCPTSSLSF